MGVFEEKQATLVNFRNVVKVNSRELILIAKDLEVLLKRSTTGNAVAFHLKGNKLEIRCMNIAYYKAVIYTEENFSDSEIVVIFKPISKMLPDNVEVQIILSPAGVEIINSSSEITILRNIATVPDLEVENYGFTGFDFVKVRSSLREILSTTSIINTLGTGVNIIMLGKYMHCKYATVYLECPSSGVVNSITMELGRILNNFLYGEDNCFLAESPTSQIFKKGNRYLVLPSNQVKEDSIMELVMQGNVRGTMSINGLFDKCKDMVQAYGNGVAKVDFYNGKVTINRQDDSCRIKATVGYSEEFLFSIEVNLEYFRDILHVVGESFTLYEREGKACLRSLDGHISIL